MIELKKDNAHIAFTTPSITGGEGGYVDLSNYYTKYEVDTKIDKIELTAGPKGEDGYTPIKGVDYFDGKDYVLTYADKQEIANMIDVPTGGGGSSSGDCEWNYTQDIYDSNLYNAREIYISCMDDNNGYQIFSYVVFSDGDILGNHAWCEYFAFTVPKDANTSYWKYDGSGIYCGDTNGPVLIAYK